MKGERYQSGKRGPLICGKVTPELFEDARSLIDGNEFKTMNDVVETAVWHFVRMRKSEGTEGGESLGN